jgi:hypothetical protein
MADLAALHATAAPLRANVAVARQNLNATDAALADTHVQLAAAQRAGADTAALAAQRDALAKQKNDALIQQKSAVDTLHETVGGLVHQIGVANPFIGLDPHVPLVLFPVRLETRFNPAKPAELLVRIIPDDVHADSHEPELTAAEADAGRAYWETTWRAGTAEPAATAGESAAWADLVAHTSVGRAAWIARTLTPANAAARPAQPTDAGNTLPVAPVLPQPPLKGASWTRAPFTTVLPDRWVVMAYRRGLRVGTAFGNAVPDHVHMGPDPSAAPPAPGTEPRVDAGLTWVVDFAAAEKIGLGVRVPVPADGGGLDRVVAFGVRLSLDPAASAARLADLLDAHHYTRGLSVVPQGTPTNNTPSDRAGWTSRPTAASSFPVERRPQAPPAASNGTVIAAALGVDAARFSSVAHASESEQTGARSMATLLWGPTMGYYLEQMLQFDGPDATQIDAARRHFIDNVRGRGPLPALRIGNQPYGILPVTSLQRWKAFGEDAATANIAPVLRAAQLFWERGAQSVPRMGGSGDLDRDFVHALTLGARSALLNVRTVQGATFCRARQILVPQGQALDPCAAAGELADAAWTAFGLRGGHLGRSFHPRVADVTYAADAAALRLPLVDGAPGPRAYLDALRTGSVAQLFADASHAATATSVLGTLARHAVLLAYGAAADALGRRALSGSAGGAATGALATKIRPEAEMFGVAPSVAAISNRFESALVSAPVKQLFAPVAGVTGTQIAADFLRSRVIDFRRTGTGRQLLDATLLDIDFALEDLAGRDVAELENLLAETLDTVSHRLDAWITSLATRRLSALRAQRPAGVYLGGFGWVENLQRRAAEPHAATPPGETGPLIADVNGGGFVHAPSLAHAATAAVLRSANLSHAGTASASDAALLIDLSSRRVCLAMELLDGVRAGQPLGALLGYRLERALHDGHPSLELDRYIAPLRRLAPLAANGVTPPNPGESLESIAARNVVDGLALSRIDAAHVRTAIAAGVGVPPATNDELNAVMADVAGIADAVDGLSDVLLSESVYHVIQGNPMRAGMTVDAINRGSVAPEPEVVRTHRSGTAITHRLMVLLPAGAGPAHGWQRIGPRAAAEPRLDAWAGRLLGDPARVRVTAHFAGPAPVSVQLSLADLVVGAGGLCALDALYDANANDDAVSTLEQRLANRLAVAPPPGVAPGFTSVNLVRGRDAEMPAPLLTLEEFVTLAASLRALVVGARHVTGTELARPEDGPEPGLDGAELRARADAALAALQNAAAALHVLLTAAPPADVLALMRATDALAAFGMLPPGHGEGSRDVASALQQASALALVAGNRLAAAAKLQAVPRPASDPSAAYDLSILDAVFGGDFRALPLCRPSNGALLATAFAASDALQGGDTGAARAWLRRTAGVRTAGTRLDDAMLFAQAVGTGAESDLRVAQIPFVAGQPWAGLPVPPPLAPTTTFVAHTTEPLDPVAGIAGLFVDEWNEVVPSATQTTGISFQSSTPRACAPQSILLAVSPDPAVPWDLDTFDAVLNETFELAQQRMVDLDTLPWAGHFLPAIYIADSAFDAVTGLHLRDIVVKANLQFQAVRTVTP